MPPQISKRRRIRQRGQELIEFTLLLFPILGFLFITIDIA
jgi:Flp pilus assembly protein TadG